MVLLGPMLVGFIPRPAWPGASSSPEARAAWATETFGPACVCGELALRVEGASGAGFVALRFANKSNADDVSARDFRATWAPEGGEAIDWP